MKISLSRLHIHLLICYNPYDRGQVFVQLSRINCRIISQLNNLYNWGQVFVQLPKINCRIISQMIPDRFIAFYTHYGLVLAMRKYRSMGAMLI